MRLTGDNQYQQPAAMVVNELFDTYSPARHAGHTETFSSDGGNAILPTRSGFVMNRVGTQLSQRRLDPAAPALQQRASLHGHASVQFGQADGKQFGQADGKGRGTHFVSNKMAHMDASSVAPQSLAPTANRNLASAPTKTFRGNQIDQKAVLKQKRSDFTYLYLSSIPPLGFILANGLTNQMPHMLW